MTEALFNSTHAAIAFAFSYSERDGRPNLLGRMSEKDRMPGEGRGLSGLDGAAQAGMILREVYALPDLHRAVVVGKFSRPTTCRACGAFHDTTARLESIEILAHHTLTKMPLERPNLALRRALVRRNLGDKLSLKELAKTCGVHHNTASNHDRKVHEIMRDLQKHAMHALDGQLAGMVESAETA